jgi:hypothetical protein
MRIKGASFQKGKLAEYAIPGSEIFGYKRASEMDVQTNQARIKNKLPTLSKKDKANGKMIKQVA